MQPIYVSEDQLKAMNHQSMFAPSVDQHHLPLATVPQTSSKLALARERNMGILCKLYLEGKKCSRGNHCPYLHVPNGEVRTLPEACCSFFQSTSCLRDNCRFFHGSAERLQQLRAAGSSTYRPQDEMQLKTPPPSPNQVDHKRHDDPRRHEALSVSKQQQLHPNQAIGLAQQQQQQQHIHGAQPVPLPYQSFVAPQNQYVSLPGMPQYFSIMSSATQPSSVPALPPSVALPATFLLPQQQQQMSQGMPQQYNPQPTLQQPYGAQPQFVFLQGTTPQWVSYPGGITQQQQIQGAYGLPGAVLQYPM